MNKNVSLMLHMKVLIIDDNESITEAVKDFFELDNIDSLLSGGAHNRMKNTKF